MSSINLTREQELVLIENECKDLQDKLIQLTSIIGNIPIANTRIMPYGWRKAAKGRTVWRIVEEVISQNLEKMSSELGFISMEPAESEVGVYDFKFRLKDNSDSFVNIKSSVKGGRTNKDDVSKAVGLIDFYENHRRARLYVATFVIDFKPDMTVSFEDCIVIPTSWIPDIYINPSNNGNLQSSMCKHPESVVKRTSDEFLQELIRANEIAKEKRNRKNSNQ